MSLRGVNLVDPVDRSHPLNAGRLAWWLALPARSGGSSWIDLTGRADAALAGYGAGAGWRPSARPGGLVELADPSGTGYGSAPASAIPAGLAGYTVAAWCRTASTGSVLLDRSVGTYEGNGITLFPGYGSVEDAGSNGYQTTAAAAATDGGWHRNLLTWSLASNTLAFYLDGVLASSTTTGARMLADWSGGPPTWIGAGGGGSASAPGYNVVGSIDDVAAWGRGFSAADAALDHDLSRRGYPGVLRRRRRGFAASAAPLFRRTLFDRAGSRGVAT